jgi:hypothetical protein
MLPMVLTTCALRTMSPPLVATSEALRASWLACARVVGVLLDGRRQLFHRRRGFFQRAGLLLGARRQVQVAGGDFVRCGGDGVGALAYLTDHVEQAVVHALERTEQAAGFVAGAGVDVGGQIARGDRLGHLHRCVQRHRDRAGDEPGDAAAQGHGGDTQADHHRLRASLHGLDFVAGLFGLRGFVGQDIGQRFQHAIQAGCGDLGELGGSVLHLAFLAQFDHFIVLDRAFFQQLVQRRQHGFFLVVGGVLDQDLAGRAVTLARLADLGQLRIDLRGAGQDNDAGQRQRDVADVVDHAVGRLHLDVLVVDDVMRAFADAAQRSESKHDGEHQQHQDDGEADAKPGSDL